MFKLLKEIFTWVFGLFISEQKERDNITKTKYEDSPEFKERRERFKRDIDRRNQEQDDE